jgi:hypothetical protein
MADQDDRAGLIRPVGCAEQVGGAGTDPKLGLYLDWQAEHFRRLNGSPGGAGQYGYLGQLLFAQPFRDFLRVFDTARSQFPVRVGHRSVAVFCLGMTPEYQVHPILLFVQAGRIDVRRDRRMTGTVGASV